MSQGNKVANVKVVLMTVARNIQSTDCVQTKSYWQSSSLQTNDLNHNPSSPSPKVQGR